LFIEIQTNVKFVLRCCKHWSDLSVVMSAVNSNSQTTLLQWCSSGRGSSSLPSYTLVQHCVGDATRR